MSSTLLYVYLCRLIININFVFRRYERERELLYFLCLQLLKKYVDCKFLPLFPENQSLYIKSRRHSRDKARGFIDFKPEVLVNRTRTRTCKSGILFILITTVHQLSLAKLSCGLVDSFSYHAIYLFSLRSILRGFSPTHWNCMYLK